MAAHHAPVSMKLAKKFDVFHQGRLGKSANINKRASPTKDSMIAASDPQQNACIMGEAVS
jgi:hypothetical protein